MENMHNYTRTSLFIALLLLFSFHLSAQQNMTWKSSKWGMFGLRYQTQTFGISENKLDTCNCGEDKRRISDRGNVGFLVSYYKNFNDRFAASVDLGFVYGRVGTLPKPTLLFSSKTFTSFRMDAYYHVGKTKQLISPYLHTGVVAQIGSVYASVPVGVGLRWMMKKNPVFITTQMDYGIGVTSKMRNNLIGSIGVYMKLRKDKRKPSTTEFSEIAGNTELRDSITKTNIIPSNELKKDSVQSSTDSTQEKLVVKDSLSLHQPSDSMIQKPADVDSLEKAKELIDTASMVKSETTVPKVIVYFEFDKFSIRKDAYQEIDRAVAYLKQSSQMNVILKGYTDNRSTQKYNLQLSRNRALAVKKALIAAGISKERILTAYFGELYPAAKGNNEASWKKNRRVEFTFVMD